MKVFGPVPSESKSAVASRLQRGPIPQAIVMQGLVPIAMRRNRRVDTYMLRRDNAIRRPSVVVSIGSLRSPKFGAFRTNCGCSATIGSPSGDRSPRRCCKTEHDEFRSAFATERGDVALAISAP